MEERDFWAFITMNYEEVLVNKVSRDYLEWLCAALLPLARPRIIQKGGRKRAAAAEAQHTGQAETDGLSRGSDFVWVAHGKNLHFGQFYFLRIQDCGRSDK